MTVERSSDPEVLATREHPISSATVKAAYACASQGETHAIFARQQADMDGLAAAGRKRRLHARSGIDFSSNDYLGLAGSPRLRNAVAGALDRGVAIGSGGARLLRGNCAEHEALEAHAASFFGSETALLFGSGYAANVAMLATLPQRGDLVVHDALVHASAHEGMRLGRADRTKFAHNDAEALEDAIRSWRRGGGTGTPWIVAESLYSMDGDRAPLDAFAAVADRHDGVLIVDEAHAVGAWGPAGRGLAASLDGAHNVITLKTMGKAMGCEGALVCCPSVVRDFLVARARGFIFSTACSPLMAVAAGESLSILADEPERRSRLHALSATAAELLGPLGVANTGSQIMPLVIGDERATMRVAGAVQAAGFDVRGIRPPTVPSGTSRLRISITLNVEAVHIAALAVALKAAL